MAKKFLSSTPISRAVAGSYDVRMAAPYVPKIKLCGITTLEDAEHAVALGVWAIGLNFWPRSARRCDPGT